MSDNNVSSPRPSPSSASDDEPLMKKVKIAGGAAAPTSTSDPKDFSVSSSSQAQPGQKRNHDGSASVNASNSGTPAPERSDSGKDKNTVQPKKKKVSFVTIHGGHPNAAYFKPVEDPSTPIPEEIPDSWGTIPLSMPPHADHLNSPPMRSTSPDKMCTPSLWEDRKQRLDHGKSADGQKHNLILKLLDMRPDKDGYPARKPMYWNWGEPIDWSNKKAIKDWNERRRQNIEKITGVGEADWTWYHRRFIAEALEENPNISLRQLTESFNYCFVDNFCCGSLSAPPQWAADIKNPKVKYPTLSGGRTIEAMRAHYLDHKEAYDKFEIPEFKQGTKEHNEELFEFPAIREHVKCYEEDNQSKAVEQNISRKDVKDTKGETGHIEGETEKQSEGQDKHTDDGSDNEPAKNNIAKPKAKKKDPEDFDVDEQVILRDLLLEDEDITSNWKICYKKYKERREAFEAKHGESKGKEQKMLSMRKHVVRFGYFYLSNRLPPVEMSDEELDAELLRLAGYQSPAKSESDLSSARSMSTPSPPCFEHVMEETDETAEPRIDVSEDADVRSEDEDFEERRPDSP